jgi:hypothetical protein
MVVRIPGTGQFSLCRLNTGDGLTAFCHGGRVVTGARIYIHNCLGRRIPVWPTAQDSTIFEQDTFLAGRG